MILQETISTLLESQKKVFVTYLDVSKAFDGVWIEGLFYRLRELGIRGRTWRLLYKTYIDFKCRARIQSKFSNWYTLTCGIHQAGFLSLFKYLVFINSLLVELEQSNLCCSIYGIPVSPLGYADDIAAATTSKAKTDRMLDTVYQHSTKWRYTFNPKKSAVLVYGESDAENRNYTRYRIFKLGNEQIKERNNYDHLGQRNSRNGDNSVRLNEKIRKGRKALNAASGLGLKPGGLTIKGCSIIFWSMTIPIVTFSSELWVLNDEDVNNIEYFQRYSGRRVQRFHPKSPNETSYAGLGWIRIEYYIYIKKLLFIRSIACLEDDSIYKRVFKAKLLLFEENQHICNQNRYDSPILDMLNVAEHFGLIAEVKGIIRGIRVYSKYQWKELVWQRAWNLEDQDWGYRTRLFKSTLNLRRTMSNICLLVWWQLGDHHPELMYQCEVMAKIVFGASNLKSDNYVYKKNGGSKYCELCNNMSVENAEHIIMHCQSLQNIRTKMLNEINELELASRTIILSNSIDLFSSLLGKIPKDTQPDIGTAYLKIVATNVYEMYRTIVLNREGIG